MAHTQFGLRERLREALGDRKLEPEVLRELERLEFQVSFYRSRCEALQSWQSSLRDPERMIVCDILANGFALARESAGDRYKIKQETDDPPEAIANGKAATKEAGRGLAPGREGDKPCAPTDR